MNIALNSEQKISICFENIMFPVKPVSWIKLRNNKFFFLNLIVSQKKIQKSFQNLFSFFKFHKGQNYVFGKFGNLALGPRLHGSNINHSYKIQDASNLFFRITFEQVISIL